MSSVIRLLCLVLALLPAALASACELRMAWKNDPPYQQEDGYGNMTGLEIEIARAALTKAGCKLRFVELPFARAMVELEGGSIDLVSGVLPIPERERYARFSAPGTLSRNIVFLRSDLAPGQGVATMDELRASELRVGVERGVAYRAKLEALLARPGAPKRVMEESTSLEGLLYMLQKRRIDAFVADEYSTTALARQLHLTARATDIVINDEPSVFAFSRRSVDAAVVERFNAALEALRRDGSIKRLETQFLALPKRSP